MRSIPSSISIEDLASVTGAGNPLDSIYKGVVFDIAAKKGGTQLAETMYGKRASDRDRARARDAMKGYLEAGDKLPAGVPNIFGSK